jgi:hypothetical protein
VADFGTVGDYLAATGLTREELGARLAERGVELKDPSRQLVPSKKITKTWAGALGLEPQLELDDDPAQPSPGRDGERPPTAPPNARPAPLPATITQLAEERIAETYNFLGGVGGMALGEPRVGQVVAAYSPTIAKAWIHAAEENEFAARVVRLMSAGGATGELLMTHLVMIGGLLYVTGRGDAFGGLYSGQFGPPPPRPAARSDNGRAAPTAAADAVGDAAGAAT